MARQMSIPFAIGPDGGVLAVTDPVQSLADRVRALTATHPGERVMRTTFGVPVSDLVFSWDPNVGQMQLNQRVTAAVSQWEPSARVLTAAPLMNPDGTEVLGVNVDISAGDPVMATEASPQYPVAITTTGDVSRTA